MPVSNASEADVIRRQDVASNQVSEPHLMTATLSTSWTTALPKRILVDLTAACGAAAVVAPIVTLIDRLVEHPFDYSCGRRHGCGCVSAVID